MVQRFLCEMPSLKVFRANLLTAHDIKRDPRPWVCKGLEEISIAFVLKTNTLPADTSDRTTEIENWRQVLQNVTFTMPLSASRVFLERLATLTKLQILDLREAIPSRSNDRPENVWYNYMKMQLDCDLDLLRTLNRLEVLVSPTCHGMGLHDAQWMVDHWPDFSTICLNQRHPARKSLYDFFGKYDIKQIWDIRTRDKWMEHKIFPRPQ